LVVASEGQDKHHNPANNRDGWNEHQQHPTSNRYVVIVSVVSHKIRRLAGLTAED
jgi:hypothetical protein